MSGYYAAIGSDIVRIDGGKVRVNPLMDKETVISSLAHLLEQYVEIAQLRNVRIAQLMGYPGGPSTEDGNNG